MRGYFKAVYSTDSIKKIESELANNGVQSFLLMMRAAHAACELLLSRSANDIIVFCGKGNNGGDGYGLAALLFMANCKVKVLQVEIPFTKEAKLARTLCTDLGIKIEEWDAKPKKGIWYVDALLGSGISRLPEGKYKTAINFLNSEKSKGKNVLSLDIPSGLNGTTGQGYGVAVQASETITFLAMKQGLLTGAAVDCVGQLTFTDLGVAAYSKTADAQILEKNDCDFGILKPSAHKGDRGNVIVFGGMEGMEGAGMLAGLASLKAGAGKVFWITNTQSLQRPPELITVKPEKNIVLDLIRNCRVCVLGPGLGAGFDSLIKTVWNSNIPIVLDADGIRWLARELPRKREGKLVVTPHPGEATDLVKGKELDRFKTILLLREHFGGDWILKGAGTLISESKTLWINKLNMPQLGTAGSGDVLAGFVAGVWSRGSKTPARTGVWLHSCFAKDAFEKKTSPFLTASDLLN